MKLHLPALCLVLLTTATVAGEAGPSKGDKVYISASFKKLSATSPVAGVNLQYDIPTCAEFTITKANSDKSTWVVTDAMNGKLHLAGAWLPRLHKDKPACEAYVSTAGEPSVERNGTTFKILPSESK